jgi:hypothetical protein
MMILDALSSRILVLILLTTSVTLFCWSDSNATLCVPSIGEKDQPYNYLVSFIDSLGYAQEAIAKVQQKQNTTRDDAFFDLMYGLKLAKSDFDCAASLVSPYTSSANEAIEMSSRSAELAFTQLAQLQAQIVADLKSILDNGPQMFQEGTAKERMAERASAMDDAWKLLLPAAISATYSVVEEDKMTNLMSRLALTRSQQKEIIKRLHSVFGPQVTKGVRAGQHSLLAAGSTLYEVIVRQPRKTRDEK